MRTLMILLAISLNSVGTFAQAPKRLFQEVPEARLRALRRTAAADEALGPAVKRSRLVEAAATLVSREAAELFARSANAAGAPPQRIELNLFDDVRPIALMRRAAFDSRGRSLVWTGDVQGDRNGTVTITNTGGVITGKVSIGNVAIYEIRPVAREPRLQRIVELDSAGFPRELPPIPVTAPQGRAMDLPERTDDGSVLDVLVVYTAAARDGAGGQAAMDGLVATAESEMNDSLATSGAVFRVRVVHAAEVAFRDSEGFDTALSKVAGHGDGVMDEVHALRNEHGADLVSLWIDNSGACGLAYLMTAQSAELFAPSAFSVVHYRCAAGYYSFGHEIGHNLGAQHDRRNSGSPGLFRYSYGHQQTATAPRFRTIMAYDCDDGPCTRVNRWSNPNGRHEGIATGVPLGQPGECDNVATINYSRVLAARWRNSVQDLLSGAPRPQRVGDTASAAKRKRGNAR